MFSIHPIGSGYGLNGQDVMIMQSSANADIVIREFQKVMSENMDPNVVIRKVLEDNNLSEADFTDQDITRINRKIESIYKSMQNGTRRNF